MCTHVCMFPEYKQISIMLFIYIGKNAERAEAAGIPLDSIQAYIDAFKYGVNPHGGAGIGALFNVTEILLLCYIVPSLPCCRLCKCA